MPSAGGNAVDAAIAAAMTLGVVDGFNSGIGGGCFMLIRRADGKILAIDGRETAHRGGDPRHVSPRRQGRRRPQPTGPLAVARARLARGVRPRAAASTASRNSPTCSCPPRRSAEQGFAIDDDYAGRLAQAAETSSRIPGVGVASCSKADGKPWPPAHVLRQPDLARSYRAMAGQGTDWFYRGTLRRQRSPGGWPTTAASSPADGFRRLTPREREPLGDDLPRATRSSASRRPAPAASTSAQILNILENFDLQKLEKQDPAPARCTSWPRR